MSIVIFDLDGTLSNPDARNCSSDGNERQFHIKCDEDKVVQEAKDLLSELAENHEIVLISGRPEYVREKTIKWLEANLIKYDALLLKDSDEEDCQYKKSILLRYLFFRGLDTKSVYLAVDDMQKNVQSYRSLGIPTLYFRIVSEGPHDKFY